MFLWSDKEMDKLNRRTVLRQLGMSVLLAAVKCSRLPNNSAYLTVDESRCTGCGECTRVCNADAFRIITNKAVLDPGKCDECGKCIEVCPVHAIQ